MSEVETAQAGASRPSDTDAALLGGLRKRTAEACAALYDRFAPGVHRFAVTRLGGDVNAAEDVVVETMVGVVQDIRRFSPRRSSLAAWVFGIGRRKIQDARRKALREKSVPAWAQTPTAHVEGLASDEDIGGSVAAQLDAQRQVAQLAVALSEAEMEVLLLHYVDGFSVGEIGRIVGRSAKAVDSLLHRARRKARAELVKSNG